MRSSILLLLLIGVLQAEDRPNIVMIMADDMGYECLSANGSLDYSTPVLDAMASRGLRFEHCYSQPICTPSRVKLMTGKSNKRNYVKFGKLDRQQTTFAQLLKKSGYATCITGKWQLGKELDAPQHFGFDKSLLWQHTRGRTDKEKHDTRFPNPRLERNGERLNYEDGEFSSDLFAEFIDRFIGEHKSEPFLVYYPMALVHCPFTPSPDSEDWDPKSHGSKTYKGEPKYFGDMVAYADKTVGKILGSLEKHGVRENTLVLFTGDNGTDTPIVTRTTYGKVIGAKGTTVDGGCRVPFVVEWPGKMKSPGRVLQDLVEFSDFLPTMCAASGVAIPKDLVLDGQSFLPQLLGEKGSPRKTIYEWYSRNGVPKKAVEFARNQRYKLYDDGKMFDVPNDRLEEKPLEDLNDKQQEIRSVLQAKLDEFEDIVPPQARSSEP